MPNIEEKRLKEEMTGALADSVSAIRQSSKITKTIIVGIISFLVVVVAITGCILTNFAAKSALKTSAELSGRVVGFAEGLIALPNAYDEGKRKGLSAEDTTAYIANKMGEVGKLEIMDAGVKISDLQTIPGYAGLYISKGVAVFSVDLKDAEITVEDDRIHVIINSPEADIYIDETSTELLAEWQKSNFTGSTKDGYFAYLNSWNNSRAELEKAVENYDDLLDAAKEAARNQITSIVKACRGKDTEVTVDFLEVTEKEETSDDSEDSVN